MDLPRHYYPAPTNFNVFYNSLLVYRQRFLRAYEVMAADNDLNVPPTHMKDGGLMKTFVEKIPFDYGFRLVKTLKTTKFDNFYDFLTTFYKIVTEHYEEGRRARVVSQHFGGTNYVTANNQTRRDQQHPPSGGATSAATGGGNATRRRSSSPAAASG
eukprot:2266540-Prorocentrum_lima.AAC.1